jgi:hypothetical protein
MNGVGMWAGPPAASGASAARPSHPLTQQAGGGGRPADLTSRHLDRTVPRRHVPDS